MNEIQTIDIDAVEAHMLTLPQIEIPVEHIFGPGIYIRQGLLPAGYIIMGHHHKIPCLNMLLTGKMALLEGGSMREITAPYIFTTKDGRKTAYMMEDCVFQNIYATEETDLNKLEEMCVEKSSAYKEIAKCG